MKNFTNYLKAFGVSCLIILIFGIIEQFVSKDLGFASGWFAATGFFLTIEYLEKIQEINK